MKSVREAVYITYQALHKNVGHIPRNDAQKVVVNPLWNLVTAEVKNNVLFAIETDE